MRLGILRFTFLSALATGCTDTSWPRPASIPSGQFTSEFNAWRDYRKSRLIVPGAGPVTWIGLWELRPGETRIGADSTLPIILPAAQSAKLVGTLQREGAEVRFAPAPAAHVLLADKTPVTGPLVLVSDRNDKPTTLAVGTLRMRLHGEPGTDRLWLRAWDEEHPARATFTMPETYPPDTTWRVAARFEPYKSPREFRVADVFADTQGFRAPGDLVFRVAGREHRLAAFAEEKDTIFFVMMWDSTARTSTYQAGRYMRIPFPDSTGWTVIDFNRAYNPPCVFSAFSACAFAPPENRLTLPINAGEKRAH